MAAVLLAMLQDSSHIGNIDDYRFGSYRLLTEALQTTRFCNSDECKMEQISKLS
jgi:hypothetical protein